MPQVTHVAAQTITIDGRYLRQLCAWCGEVLIDYDLANVAMVVTPDDPNPTPATWPTGNLVRVDGNVSTTLDENEQLPDDFCGAAMFLEPSQFNAE